MVIGALVVLAYLAHLQRGANELLVDDSRPDRVRSAASRTTL